ncbi:MAG TPA: lysyl oxidase family protein [Candidatus Binatia bacterium]
MAAPLVAAGAAPALALPDLVPEISDIRVDVRDVLKGDVTEGCAEGQYAQRLVDFSLLTRNIGPDDLILGNPGCPNCTLNPGAPCINPLFVCGTAHGHAHFDSFAKTEILDSTGTVVATGHKYGFCLLDLECTDPHYSCSYQGITSGCADVYSAGLPCQYVDITDENLADGVYTLRVTIDPDNVIQEADETNNVVEAQFTVGETPRVCPLYSATDVPQDIPDLGSVQSSIHVPDLGPVSSVRVRMNGTHTYVSDLDATLTSPATTTRTLFSDKCGSDDNFDLYLGDDAVDPFICPATDASALRPPDQSMSAFDGEASGGDWTLKVADTAPNDTGVLDAWGVEVCAQCGNGALDPGEACDDGNQLDGDCCSADCHTAASDGTSCEDGNLCTTSETCSSGQCVPHADVQCDPCLICDQDRGCIVPDLIYPCQQPATGNSLIRIRHDDSDTDRDQVLWKWRSITPVELDEFGAPDIVTNISLCVYDGGKLLMSSTIPAAQACDGAPCWNREEHEAFFNDPSGQFGGLTAIKIKEGANGTIQLRGRGGGLGLTSLYPSLPTTVRMRRNDGTPCWEANFDSTLISSGTQFKARSR